MERAAEASAATITNLLCSILKRDKSNENTIFEESLEDFFTYPSPTKAKTESILAKICQIMIFRTRIIRFIRSRIFNFL